MALSFTAQDFIDKIYKAAGEASAHYAAWYTQQITKYWNEVVGIWYKGYAPKFYTRHESLYNVLTAWSTGDGEGFARLSSDRITPTRSGNRDYIYELTVRGGWHGGAISTQADGADVDEQTNVLLPRYRTPYKRYTYWGSVAAHNTAPIEALRDVMIEELPQTKIDAKWQAVFNQHLSKVLSR